MEKKNQTNLITLRNFSPHFANSVIQWTWFCSRSSPASISLFLCKTTTKSKIVMFTLCLQWELLHLEQLEKKVSCVVFVLLCSWFLIFYWLPMMVPILSGHYSWIFTWWPSYYHPVPCWRWRQKEKPIILTLFKNLIFVYHELLLHIWLGKVYFNIVVFRPLILYI